MNPLHRKLAVIAAGLGVSALAAPSAEAYQYLICDDEPVRWPAAFGMVQNLCSVAAGSSQESAYASAIAQYRNVTGMSDMVFHQGIWPSNDCTIDLDDDWNDFALVDQAQIDGALGSTLVTRSCEEILEVNIRMANLDTQNFVNPDEAFRVGQNPFNPGSTGHTAVLHEFGHAHGLAIGASSLPDNHPTTFSIMRASTPLPLAGGLGVSHSRLMPDDVDGGRFLYPSGSAQADLLASAQRLQSSPNAIVNNAAWGTINKCRGDSVTFGWTTANTGTSALTSNQRFFIAPSDAAHNQTGVTLATWFSATVNPENQVHQTITANIPCGTAPGLYWVYHKADSANSVAEVVESDNVVHNPMTLQIQSCGCS